MTYCKLIGMFEKRGAKDMAVLKGEFAFKKKITATSQKQEWLRGVNHLSHTPGHTPMALSWPFILLPQERTLIVIERSNHTKGSIFVTGVYLEG